MTTAQWVFVLVVGVVGVGLVVWSVPSRGRHRRKWWQRRNRVAPVVLPEPAVAPCASIKTVMPRCSSDDWMSDPPTDVFPPMRVMQITDAEVDAALDAAGYMPVAQRHTSPSESLRVRYELESPVFWEMAKDLGFDAVRGWDSLFAIDGLVTA